MVVGNLWKKASDEYSIQFDNVKPREKRTILGIFRDWRSVGSGFKRDGSEVLIFSKKVGEEENIYLSLRELPFPLFEEKKSGKLVKVKTGRKSLPLTPTKNCGKIKTSRTCSKCGVKGHNSRTCKG